jgi:cytoskeleton protein RodZ
MATTDERARLPIGEVLKRTRIRRKLDIRTVEQEIKIRAKYLRALENEEWETLPGPAYAKGFLRTYAQFLGLDGDTLVEEYRREVESSLGPDQPYHFAEPVLERRLRSGEEARSRWASTAPVIAAIGAATVAVLVVIGLIGGSGSEHHRHHGKAHRHDHRKSAANGAEASSGSQSGPMTLSLVTHDGMEVCLLPGHGLPLLDAQTLAPGAEEGPYEADNFRLDLDSGGAATVTLEGKPHRVSSRRPASFAIDSGGIREIEFKGPGCP